MQKPKYGGAPLTIEYISSGKPMEEGCTYFFSTYRAMTEEKSLFSTVLFGHHHLKHMYSRNTVQYTGALTKRIIS